VWRLDDGAAYLIADSEDRAWELWAERSGERIEDYKPTTMMTALRSTDTVRITCDSAVVARCTLTEAYISGSDPAVASVSVEMGGGDFLSAWFTEHHPTTISAPARWWVVLPECYLGGRDW